MDRPEAFEKRQSKRNMPRSVAIEQIALAVTNLNSRLKDMDDTELSGTARFLKALSLREGLRGSCSDIPPDIQFDVNRCMYERPKGVSSYRALDETGIPPLPPADFAVCLHHKKPNKIISRLECKEGICSLYKAVKSQDRLVKRVPHDIKPCDYAKDTDKKYNDNLPCRGNRVECQHPENEGHISCPSLCIPTKCKFHTTEAHFS